MTNLPVLAQQLIPFLLPLLPQQQTTAAASASALLQHELSSGLHVGTLADVQAPQFLKSDGTRMLTGNLAVKDGVTIDGVDLSVHAGNPSAHHALVTAGDGMSVTGQQVAVNSTVVRTTRQVLAGNGLTGGGALSTDVTLNVGAGTLIAVAADTVGLANGSAQYQVPVTGASPYTPAYTALSTFAGSGLTFVSGTFAVGAGDGITVAADTVALTTPGGLTAATTNSAAGSHTHAIATAAAVGLSVSTTNAVGTSASLARADHTHAITSSSDPGAAARLLASDASGFLTLVQLTGTTRVRTPLLDTAAGVSMTISPTLDLILNPGSGLVRMASGDAIQASSYASQTTGWRITDVGEGDFRYLFADEMHVKSFIADLEQALAGGQIISKSVAVLATDFTLPAAGATGTLRVRDLPSAPNMAVFQAGDFVGLRRFSRASGSLTVGWAWGTVTSYADGTGGNEGTQTWTFTRHASTPGAASGTIAAESLVLDFGTSGNGFYEVNAIDGAYGLNSPYAQIVTWQTHPATQTVRTRFGNLRGITNVTGEFGMFAGSGTAVTDRYIRASSTAVELRNTPLAMYDGANNTALLSAGAGNNAPSFAMGSPLPTAPLTNTGIWMGLSGGAYQFRVGSISGGALSQGLHWDGSSLNVRGQITVQTGSTGYTNISDRPTSIVGINPAEYAQLTTGQTTFSETWDGEDPISQWSGSSAERSIVTDVSSQMGGKFLRIGNNSGNDNIYSVHSRRIPFNPNKLYKMRVRARRTAGSGTFYCGVAGVASDGNTYVNTAGNDTLSSQHYVVAVAANPPTTWTEYIGYVQGWGSPTGNYGISPAKLHADVRYMRPIILANYPSLPGIVEVDFIEFTEYDWPSVAGLYLTPLYSGYWTGSAWRSYFDSGGNFYLNAGAGSNFLAWNGSTLTINGAIVIQAGSSGIGSFSDAGALATQSSVTWASQVTGTGKPADNATVGATWGTNLTGRPVELTDGRITTAISSGGVIQSRVDPGVNWGANPGAGVAGLLLGADYMGYWTGTVWRTYMDNAGRFYVNAGAGSNYMAWDGSTLTVNGAINVTGGNAATTTYVDSADAGKANTSLNNSTISTLINGASIRVGSGTKDSNLNGWNIDSGEIVGQLAGVDQVVMNTSGQIVAGAGAVKMSRHGVYVQYSGNSPTFTWPLQHGGIHVFENVSTEANPISSLIIAEPPRVYGSFAPRIRSWMWRINHNATYVPPNGPPTGYYTPPDDALLLVYNDVEYKVYHSGSRTVGIWTTLTLTSPWGNNGSGWAAAQYAVFGDWVAIKGLVTPSSNQAASATIATLPAAIRPSESRRFGSYAAGAGCALDVLSTGVVRFSVAVNAGQSGSIECMYKR